MATKSQPLDICTQGLYSSYSYDYFMDSQNNLFGYLNQSEHSSSNSSVNPLIDGAKKQYNCFNCNKKFVDWICNQRKYCSQSCWANSNEFNIIVKNPLRREKIRRSKLGKKRPNEVIEKLRLARLNNPQEKCLNCSQFKGSNHKCPDSNWIKGLSAKNDFRVKKLVKNLKKMNAKNKGKTYERIYGEQKAQEIKKRMSEIRKGKKFSEIHKLRLSISNSGENGSNWRGGINFEPYDYMFNRRLKEQIRKRDGYLCQLCSKHQKQLFKKTKNGKIKYKLIVHHIDYNKKNSISSNLISLCNPCHGKTGLDRRHWESYFKKLMCLCQY